MFQKQGWVKIAVLIAAVAMLSGCEKKLASPGGGRGEMNYPKNTPIVISGGSITGHTRHKKDWFLPNSTTSCPKDGKSGSLTCWANAITPVAVVTDANFLDDKTGQCLYQTLNDPSWQVIVTGTDGNDNPSLTIQPVQGCSLAQGEACVSFTIGNSSSAHFGPRHQKIEGIFYWLGLNPHHGRSVCTGGKCDQYRLSAMSVSIGGAQVASATCKDSGSCLVCFTDSKSDKSACVR